MSDNRTHRFRPSKSIAEVPHINCLLCRACHFVCASEESRRTHLICPRNRAPRRFYRLLPRPILCRPYHLRRPCPLSLQIPQVNDLARPRRPAAPPPATLLHASIVSPPHVAHCPAYLVPATHAQWTGLALHCKHWSAAVPRTDSEQKPHAYVPS